ncbi:MAG TPA: tandem-95 repeat protein, partial [Candidatus Acetothermia bacterium]|nr:tandem-95 repeat protein [Candidatus Acetothermia bacterium]
MHVTEICQRSVRRTSHECFSAVINSRCSFCYLLRMMKMNTKRRILCSLLLVLTVSIGMAALADTPAASDDTASTAEDSALTIAVLANDTGLGDTPITVSLTTSPSTGTASVNADNTITYTPVTNYNGTDTFTYQVEDADHQTSTAQVTVNVVSVNDTPVLEDNMFATEVDTPVTITLRATDPELDTFYPEDDLLTFAIVAGPEHGTIDGDMAQITYETPHTAIVTLTYTPEAGFSGDDGITFSVTDIDGAISTAQIQIKVGVSPEVGLLSGRWT